jgi:hypothetical protein
MTVMVEVGEIQIELFLLLPENAPELGGFEVAVHLLQEPGLDSFQKTVEVFWFHPPDTSTKPPCSRSRPQASWNLGNGFIESGIAEPRAQGVRNLNITIVKVTLLSLTLNTLWGVNTD